MPIIILLVKNLLMLIILLFSEEIETNSKSPKFEVGDRVRITMYKSIFSKGYTEIFSKEMFLICSVLKTNPWTYKNKYLTGETIIGSFYGKELLLNK